MNHLLATGQKYAINVQDIPILRPQDRAEGVSALLQASCRLPKFQYGVLKLVVNITCRLRSARPFFQTFNRGQDTSARTSPCITITKEIKAHSNCQQKDLIFKMLHLFCQKFKGPDYHRDKGVKSNFSAEFVDTIRYAQSVL